MSDVDRSVSIKDATKWFLDAKFQVRDVVHGKTFGFKSLDDLAMFVGKVLKEIGYEVQT